MKTLIKVIISLVLLIVLLIACGAIISIGFVGAWLHTYNAFTSKTKVAEVVISEQKEDENGEYIDVEFTPVKAESAWSRVFFSDKSNDEIGETQYYKLYGDTVHIGGPIVKFEDELILLNFKTIYKVSKIFARYNIDNELEINRNETQQQMSSYDLNGGIDSTWKNMHEVLGDGSLKGSVYDLFVDTTQLDVPGQFAANQPREYNLYITNNGFLWEQK